MDSTVGLGGEDAIEGIVVNLLEEDGKLEVVQRRCKNGSPGRGQGRKRRTSSVFTGGWQKAVVLHAGCVLLDVPAGLALPGADAAGIAVGGDLEDALAGAGSATAMEDGACRRCNQACGICDFDGGACVRRSAVAQRLSAICAGGWGEVGIVASVPIRLCAEVSIR